MSFSTKARRRNGVAVVLLAAGTAAAAGPPQESLIWDNLPSWTYDNAFMSQMDTDYPFSCQTSDDFRLRDQIPEATREYAITRLEWLTAYWCGFPGNPITAFNFYVYEDAGGRPVGGPDDPSKLALYLVTVPIEDCVETPYDDPCPAPAEEAFDLATARGDANSDRCCTDAFNYTTTLPEPLIIDAERTYWLAIQGVISFPPKSGTVMSPVLRGFDTHHGDPLVGYDYWTPMADIAGAEYSLAFHLYGYADPQADIDDDGDTDTRDFGILATCFSGDGIPTDPQRILCRRCDHDQDTDVDLADYLWFMTGLQGP